jgi:YidC/Oxa1 family membrane protein insertase
MDQRRHILFFVLAILIFAINWIVLPRFMPKQQQPPANQQAANQQQPGKPGEKAPGDKPADKLAADEPAAGELAAGKGGDETNKPEKAAKPAQIAAPKEKIPDQWATLGSGDPGSPYRMLVTFTNRGAAVERIELNSPRYTDVEKWEDRSGYLGNMNEIDAPKQAGCLLRVVGPGTPAGDAGLQAGDVITALAGRPINDSTDYIIAMKQTRVGQNVEIKARRDDKPLTMSAVLGQHPLAVVKPEHPDPLVNPEKTDPMSFLLTLEKLDDQELAAGKEELPGLTMRTGNWKLERGKQENELAFSYKLPEQDLEIVKHFRLAEVPAKDAADSNFPAYHLELTVELRNGGKRQHTVAYRLDGPTGLPTEGSWYAYKISPVWWDSPGLRDVVVGFKKSAKRSTYTLVSCRKVADKDKPPAPWSGQPLLYIGVDSQYFASALLPVEPGESADEAADPFASEMPILAGPVPEKAAAKKLTDVSCRIISKPITLKAGTSRQQQFKIFAGPKKPDLLSQYGLSNLVEYGMFWFVAQPMLAVLHAVHQFIPNYGIAIILLTVLVRSAMFPISRRQALNAQKMQELQPELKRITEKYKGNLEQRGKAQQELFRKHNYHPMAGCLPAFLQLPIFMGLYRSLAVDVELRQAPLLSQSIRWCSNLSAPDMLWRWEPYLPGFLASPDGWLGPYLNVLPLITIGLFIWQQKMFMPPPTDEQSALQQKMMQYMMVFVSLMFFKVPSGLCLYFIASSLWGIAERKLLPRNTPTAAGTIDVRSRSVATSTNGAAAKEAAAKKRQRGKK